MTITVTEDRQVEINGYLYRLKGDVVKGGWSDPFPSQITPTTSYDNLRELASLIMNDFRGGIGVEEAVQASDVNRCWWTNSIIKYPTHILPPRKATALIWPTGTSAMTSGMELSNGRFENWTGTTPDGFTEVFGAVTASYVAGYTGLAARLTSSNTPASGYWTQAIVTFDSDIIGQTVTARVRVRTSQAAGANTAYIQLVDTSTNTADTLVPAVNDTWEWLTVSHTVAAGATSLTIKVGASVLNNTITMDFDDLEVDIPTSGTIRFANFNGYKYCANGNVLLKMNAGRTAYTVSKVFYGAITALIPSLNNRLYIYQGDIDHFWWMSTAEAFTESEASTHSSNGANANWGIQFDGKLWKCNTSGNTFYSSDPDAATPTWADAGSITDIASQIEGFEIAGDANGVDTLYCITHSRLKAWDSTTPQWVDTKASLNHPIGGRGHAYWNKALYLSNGLGVKGYDAPNGSFLDVGLTERDGLPVEYNAEITKLYGESGSEGMFAALDSSVPSGNSESSLILYDGIGWHPWWTPPTTLVEECESATGWTSAASWVATADTSDFQVGAASVKFAIPAGAAAGSSAYKVISTDVTGHNYVRFRFKSSVALDASDLRMALSSGAVYPLNASLPAIAANTWTEVNLAITTTVAGAATVIWLIMDVDKGAFNCWLDRVEAKSYNGAMYDIIVSSAGSAYAVYFDHAGTVYYIDIPRGVQNPDKITQSYATSGIWISSWFDAGNGAAAKLAKVLADTAKGVTTTETITIKYRIDHTYTDLDTGWTTLATLDTTAESGYAANQFASLAGISFKAIQFRLDFLTAGSTSKADMKNMVLYFDKRTGSETKRFWNATVVLNDEFNTTAMQKVRYLKSAIESSTDSTFSYHPNDDATESYYVKVLCPKFDETTGRKYGAEYDLVLRETW